MDRAFMLEFINDNRTKPWLKHRELKELDSDPSVLDMIKAIPPLMGPLQEKLDKAFYPNVAEDAATVRELIGRFQAGGHVLSADRPWLYSTSVGAIAVTSCTPRAALRRHL
jgi:hypothetical protein